MHDRCSIRSLQLTNARHICVLKLYIIVRLYTSHAFILKCHRLSYRLSQLFQSNLQYRGSCTPLEAAQLGLQRWSAFFGAFIFVPTFISQISYFFSIISVFLVFCPCCFHVRGIPSVIHALYMDPFFLNCLLYFNSLERLCFMLFI